MNQQLVRQARRALSRLIRPLIRTLLRYGVTYEEFAAAAKKAYVEVAEQEFSLTTRPASKSRIALLTGLNRREVARILALPAEDIGIGLESLNRSARIVSSWVREARYQDGAGQPAPLPLSEAEPSFFSLVAGHGTEVPPMAVLRELKNAGVVRESEDGRVELVTKGYVPNSNEIDKLSLLGTDVAALLDTIDNNLQSGRRPRFQRKVSFPRLSARGVAILEGFAAEHGQRLLEELDDELAGHNQGDAEETHFAGMGLYVFVQPHDEEF